VDGGGMSAAISGPRTFLHGSLILDSSIHYHQKFEGQTTGV